MICPRCRAAELHVRREDHAYADAGHPDVVLVACEVGWCPSCGTRGAIIPCVPQLEELVATGVHRVAFDEDTQQWSAAPVVVDVN